MFIRLYATELGGFRVLKQREREREGQKNGQTMGCLPLCLIESGQHLSAPNASSLTTRVSTAEIKQKAERAESSQGLH